MKKFILVIFALFLIGCEDDPKPVETVQASDYNVSLLFEHDGCKVFRFHDAGYPRYFTNCTETFSTTTYRRGKSRTTVIEIVRNGK